MKFLRCEFSLLRKKNGEFISNHPTLIQMDVALDHVWLCGDGTVTTVIQLFVPHISRLAEQHMSSK